MIENTIAEYRIKGFPKIWVADNGDGTFRNPILYSDYSDPDMIRVGDDFFMIASSFNCIPGLPVLHSKDLVNWKIVNYIVKDGIPFEEYKKPQHGKAIWAPSLRYHDGYYWMFVGMPDEGIFMSKTKDPFGKWDPLVCIKKIKGWIDTCPLWDDDGNAYLVNGFAKSRIGFKSVLAVSKMKPDGTALLDEFRIIYDGNEKNPTVEGPKFYKRNGYYYIFAPAGGVTIGWQLVFRSKNVYGPYEDRIVLHQGKTPVNGPHQGGWVELENGECWFLHFQDVEAYGRIVHMQPMRWVDDWPVIGEDTNGDGIGEPVLTYKKPNVGKTYLIEVPQTSDDFDTLELGLQWQWHANPCSGWYSLVEHKSHIRLYPAIRDEAKFTKVWNEPNLLLQKFPAPVFTMTTKMEFNPGASGEMSGLLVMGNEYSYLALKKTDDSMRIALYKGTKKESIMSDTEIESRDVNSGAIYLRVSVKWESECTFSYSFDGEIFETIGSTFKAQPGGWIGAKAGIFYIKPVKGQSPGYSDFDWYLVEEA